MTTMVEITKRSRNRAMQALNMRRDGKLFREIGEALGVGIDRARDLVSKGEREEMRRNTLGKCAGCNGVGHVGGLTPEGYESQPCPFCTDSGEGNKS